MMEKIKANFNYVLCTCMGLLHFILMAFRYCATFYKYDGERETFLKFSGYDLMKFEDFEGTDAEFLSTVNGILQIFLLIIAVGMVLYGALGLLKAFGVFEQFPDNIGKYESKKVAAMALRAYGGLTSLLLVFLIIWAAANTETQEIWGTKITAGVSISFGVIITFVLAIAATVAPILLPKYIPGLNEGGAASSGPQFVYRCAQCGKKAGKTERFCSACGGSVVAEQVKQYDYVCGGCGKKMKKTDRFCNVCGGAVTAVEIKHYEYVCGGCGKKMKKTDRFCNVCGGAMVQREIVPMAPVAPAPVAPVAPAAPAAGPVCPNCGKALAEGQRFCNACGTKIF